MFKQWRIGLEVLALLMKIAWYHNIEARRGTLYWKRT
jgi:hypothetical protein